MEFLNTFRISASALSAQRLRMDVIANNIANAETTRTTQGSVYQRMQVRFLPRPNEALPFFTLLRQNFSGPAAQLPTQGVMVATVERDTGPGRIVYEPNHPDADEEGFVTYPNVNVITEMADMVAATRAYEANITVLNATKAMALKALELGR